MSDRKPKIVKIEKPENTVIELTSEQIELKEKFLEIDKKVNDLEYVLTTIMQENNESIFDEEVISSIIGYSAMSAASSIVSEYFGVKNINLSDLL